MYFEDHHPPHFHAAYGGTEAVIEIESLEVTRGRVPRRVLRLILEWAVLHRSELRANWNRASSGLDLLPIQPLG
jgi:phosphomannomutase